MAGIDVSYDENSPSITVWFDYPRKFDHQEKKGDLILKKDVKGIVIGVEHRSYFAHDPKPNWWSQ